MLKVRIIAIIIALVLTLITIQLIPIVVDYYNSFIGGLNKEQQVWFNWAQAGLGFLVAAFSFWLWKKSSKPKE